MKMSKKKNNETVEISKSKQKRLDRQHEIKVEKRHKRASLIIGIIIAAAIIGVFAFNIGKVAYLAIIRTTSISDMSTGLTDEGLIDGVTTSDYINLCDFENMVVPLSEVAATDEEVDADILSTLEANEELSSDTTLAVADGDMVNIDYVGSIDGEEFENGSDTAYDLTIGSGTFIDDFETQLIGHNIGENVTVLVTFPDDYSSEDLAGKDASFEVTINGIYVTPELTDEFVAANLSEYATTADEYRAYVENTYYEQHLEEYISNYIIENTTVNSYPKDYLNTLKGILKYQDESNAAYYSEMFAAYGMSYENPWDLYGLADEYAYEADLSSRAETNCKSNLVYQAIFEKAGLSVDYDAFTEENGEDSVTSMEETYGIGYIKQTLIVDAVTDYLMETVTVE